MQSLICATGLCDVGCKHYAPTYLTMWECSLEPSRSSLHVAYIRGTLYMVVDTHFLAFMQQESIGKVILEDREQEMGCSDEGAMN